MTVKIRPQEVTVKMFVAWLKTKNPHEKFDYFNTENCCLCQFARDHGYEDPRAGGDYFREDSEDPAGQVIDEIAVAVGYYNERSDERTFGGVLKRLEGAK